VISITETHGVVLLGEITQFLTLITLMFPFKELRVTSTCSFLQSFLSNISDLITYTHFLMHLKSSVIVILRNVNFPLLCV
jgi:hypothetical protein